MFNLRKIILSVLFLSLFTCPLALGWIGNLFHDDQTPLDFSTYWNQVTPENGGKWASCEQSRDDWGYWSWLDAAYDYATGQGYPFKEHCMVWGHSSGEPSWVCGLSQSEQRAEVEEWFSAFRNRYSPNLCDVVNEPLHDPPCYADALGGSGSSGWDWVAWCFENYSGGTEIVNEYNVLSYSSDASSIRTVKNAAGAQAVGAEGHSLESVSASTISSNANTIGGTIYVSELDIRGSDSQQLSIYQDIFPTLQSISSGTTLWGYVQGTMWRSDAYLITSSGSRRPAMDWLCSNYLGCGGGSTSTTTTAASTSTTTTSATTSTTSGGGCDCGTCDWYGTNIPMCCESCSGWGWYDGGCRRSCVCPSSCEGGCVGSQCGGSTSTTTTAASTSTTTTAASTSTTTTSGATTSTTTTSGGGCSCGTCNWYGTNYPMCCESCSGWGWYDGGCQRSCVCESTCNSQ